MKTKPGDVHMVDLGIGGKVRPMMVVSREANDPARAIAICIPITTKYRGSLYEVELPRVPFLRELSFANVQGIMAIQHHELGRSMGRMNEQILIRVKVALRYALDL